MNINELLSTPEAKLTAIKIIIAIASGSFCASAVLTDCKINHIKYRWLFGILCFIFTPLTAFYFIFRKMFKTEVPFVCAKCGKAAPKDRKVCKKCGGERFVTLQFENVGEMKNKIIISLVVALILYAAGYWADNYSPLANEISDSASQEMYDDYDSFDEEYGEDAEFENDSAVILDI